MALSITEDTLSRDGTETPVGGTVTTSWSVVGATPGNTTLTGTGTLTSGSAIVTGIADVTGFYPGMPISGTGVPASTTIQSIDSASQITLTAAATATGTPTLSVVSSDDCKVRILVEATIPSYYLNRPLKNYDLKPLGNGYWKVTPRYERRTGEKRFKFSTGGGKTKMLQSYGSQYYTNPVGGNTTATRSCEVTVSEAVVALISGSMTGIPLGAAITGAGIPAATTLTAINSLSPVFGVASFNMSQAATFSANPTTLTFTYPQATDFKNAINVSDKNIPEGVDVLIPAFHFTLQVTIPNGAKANAYAALVTQLTAHVNSQLVNITIQGIANSFAPGELLFEYAEGGLSNTEDFEATLYFSAEKNLSGLKFGDIGGVTKNGHDYLWVKYTESYDSNTSVKILTPKQVCVEQCYLYDDLNPLFE